MGTSFVGRNEIRQQLGQLIDREQLVTLTGTGGIGKTRLAGEVAAIHAESGETTALVELAPARAGDNLEVILARQLGHGSLDAFVVGLDMVSTLIILDNCEHLVSEAAELAVRLTQHPNITVLATSRSPLSVRGEFVINLGPLATSAEGEDQPNRALELFLDRAATAGASWLDVPEQNVAAQEIVRRLDGVPLAIELAAARTRGIGPVDLLALLPRQLDVLDDGLDDASGRHRGIRSAVRASYEPMSPACQRAFRSLSLIPQGVDLGLAHALIGGDDKLDTVDLLTQLIDQSLVYTSPTATGDIVYRLLEPVRAFGREQLDVMEEAASTSDRYVDAVGEFANRIVVATATSFSGELLDQIAVRYTHLLQAIELALEIDELPSRAYRLLLPLYAPTKAPRREQARLAARVRDRWPDAEDPFRAAAYAIMAHIALWAGNDDPTPYALVALHDPKATRIARIIALRVLAFHAGQRGDREAARAHVEAALEIAATRGGSFERELKMSWASLIDNPDQIDEAIEMASAMSMFAAESGEVVTVVWAASVCVHQHIRVGRIAAARVEAERAAVFAESATSPWPTASAQRALASVCSAERNWQAALVYFRAALESVVSIGDIEGITLTVRSAAVAAEHCGEHDSARELWTAVPTRNGASTLPTLFTDAENELLVQMGEPLPLPLSDAIRVARDALSTTGDTMEKSSRPDPHNAVFRFDGYEVHQSRRELRHEGIEIHVEPQVFDVLTRLILDAGKMVSKEQLMDDVWGSRFVSPSALTSRIKSARAATGDDGKAQRVIRTVHGRGFMFVAELD
jgi:predicted ATPase/DNA-binding winged helix-turn-helix (wHTH) protein